MSKQKQFETWCEKKGQCPVCGHKEQGQDYCKSCRRAGWNEGRKLFRTVAKQLAEALEDLVEKGCYCAELNDAGLCCECKARAALAAWKEVHDE